MLTIYLAGAIRDNNKADEQWRNHMTKACAYLHDRVRVLNPLAGNVFDKGIWSVGGKPNTIEYLLHKNLWAVSQADVIIFNFLAMTEGYPCIGTLIEFGYSLSKPILRFVILPSTYTGHDNKAMYKLHPFIQHNASQQFETVPECGKFLKEYLPVMLGEASVTNLYGKEK